MVIFNESPPRILVSDSALAEAHFRSAKQSRWLQKYSRKCAQDEVESLLYIYSSSIYASNSIYCTSSTHPAINLLRIRIPAFASR